MSTERIRFFLFCMTKFCLVMLWLREKPDGGCGLSVVRFIPFPSSLESYAFPSSIQIFPAFIGSNENLSPVDVKVLPTLSVQDLWVKWWSTSWWLVGSSPASAKASLRAVWEPSSSRAVCMWRPSKSTRTSTSTQGLFPPTSTVRQQTLLLIKTAVCSGCDCFPPTHFQVRCLCSMTAGRWT